jgi:ankyrin repeat protein
MDLTDNSLLEAFRNDNIEEVKRLIMKASTETKNTSFVWACFQGRLEIVKLLLEHGVDIHYDNDNAIRLASYGENLDIVKLLVERGANIHAHNDYALEIASEHESTELIKYFENLILKEKINGIS